MSEFISKIKNFSDTEKFELLHKQFSTQELIEILDELLEIDPKQFSALELFDCCGTGGDKANTFNISTTTAILAAATGIKVCKNGGRSSSSTTGSIDVLEALAINLDIDLETKIENLKKFGLSFHNSKAIAESLAPLKNFAREHKLSSFLSLLGPFTNPFILKAQVIGVGKKEWFESMTGLAQDSIDKGYCQRIALVQSTNDAGQIFDELCSIAKAKIRIIEKLGFFDFDFDPGDFALKAGAWHELEAGKNHQENAKIIEAVINNASDQTKIQTCLINLALLLTLDNFNLSTETIKDLLQKNYNYAKGKLEDGSCKSAWLEVRNAL